MNWRARSAHCMLGTRSLHPTPDDRQRLGRCLSPRPRRLRRDAASSALPDGARIALQFVLNYEEGAENSVLHGDAASETFLSEIIGATAFTDRHLSMESMY